MTSVGVVGAGTMGAGIAQVALEAGDEVVIHDVDPGAVERARERVRSGLARRVAKLGVAADAIETWVGERLARLRSAVTLDAVAAEAEIVIEAAVEDLDLKQTIFRTLDASAPPDTILATNTSALSVAAIARATSRPERVIGLHFFHPVPLMVLVEVVATDAVAAHVVERASTLMTTWGKTVVRCTDTPGFIVNRVNRPFTIQALRMLEAGEASVEAIDTAMREAGFPMGPFELMDLVGIDVNLAAATGVWEGLGRPERLRPSPIQERLVNAGHLGRKTGRGFYRYEGGTRGEVAVDVAGGGSSLAADEVRDRIIVALGNEARRAVDDGVATQGDIDLAMRLGTRHPRSLFA